MQTNRAAGAHQPPDQTRPEPLKWAAFLESSVLLCFKGWDLLQVRPYSRVVRPEKQSVRIFNQFKSKIREGIIKAKSLDNKNV